jgi:hypothetical protein
VIGSGIFDGVLVVAAWVMVGLGLISAVRMWTNPDLSDWSYSLEYPWLSRSSEAWRRAYRRMVVPVVGFFVGLAGGLTFDSGLAFGTSAVLLLVSSVFWATVVLFNRPKLLVPPLLKNEPGFLADRRSDSRGPNRNETR